MVTYRSLASLIRQTTTISQMQRLTLERWIELRCTVRIVQDQGWHALWDMRHLICPTQVGGEVG